MLSSHCGVGLGSRSLGTQVLFIHLMIPKIQKNNPIYRVTMGVMADGFWDVTYHSRGPQKKKTTSGPFRSTMVLREKAFT